MIKFEFELREEREEAKHGWMETEEEDKEGVRTCMAGPMMRGGEAKERGGGGDEVRAWMREREG